MLLFTKADNTARKGEQRNNLADLGDSMKQPDRDVCEEILKNVRLEYTWNQDFNTNLIFFPDSLPPPQLIKVFRFFFFSGRHPSLSLRLLEEVDAPVMSRSEAEEIHTNLRTLQDWPTSYLPFPSCVPPVHPLSLCLFSLVLTSLWSPNWYRALFSSLNHLIFYLPF